MERWLVEHVRRHFPRHAEALGDSGLRKTIQVTIVRATAHGFARDQDVCHYVDLTMMLGEQFETRPDAPWASAILSDLSVPAEDRMSRLYVAAVQHFQRIAAVGAASV